MCFSAPRRFFARKNNVTCCNFYHFFINCMSMKTIGIGIIGFGCVGSGTVRILQDNKDIISRRLHGIDLRLKTICDRNIDQKNTNFIDPNISLVTDFEEILNDPEIHIVTELIGGINPAKEIILRALKSGKSVVTANKALLAEFGQEIFSACNEKASIAFEAAVCGAIPILRSIREGLSSDSIKAFYGILNGSTNFLLSEMETHHRDFEEVLAEAKDKGYVESDPSLDIDGLDAAHKVSLLAQMCFGMKVDFFSLSIQGISEIESFDFIYAGKLGYTIKLIGMGKLTPKGEMILSVRPTLIPSQSILAKVSGSLNAVYIVGEKMGETMYFGRGAGDTPTGGSVSADIISLARDIAFSNVSRVYPLSFGELFEGKVADLNEIFYPYYVRFVVKDQPGIIAAIAMILKKYDINIDAVLQEPFMNRDRLPFVMTLEETSEENLLQAMIEIEKLDFLVKKPFFMRIDLLK